MSKHSAFVKLRRRLRGVRPFRMSEAVSADFVQGPLAFSCRRTNFCNVGPRGNRLLRNPILFSSSLPRGAQPILPMAVPCRGVYAAYGGLAFGGRNLFLIACAAQSFSQRQLMPAATKNRSVVTSPYDPLECVAHASLFDIFRFRSVFHRAWLQAQHSPANLFKWRSGLR